MEKVTGWFANLFLKEAKPFSDKRDLDTARIMNIAGILVALVVVGLIAWPTPVPESTVFSERRDSSGRVIEGGGDLEDNTLSQLRDSQKAANDPSNRIPSLAELMGIDISNGGGGSGGGGANRSMGASMILMRQGFDAKTQLARGTKIEIRILSALSLGGSGAMPVRGIVERDVEFESSIAIPKGSEVFGDASFNASTGRAEIAWKELHFFDGRVRELLAVGVGRDGRVGIEGKVHSGAAKETTGKILSRFIGGFADGAISRTQTGESEGGFENGLKGAFSETARDQAESWAEDLKKTSPWLELKENTISGAILTDTFAFREAGSVR